MAPQNQLSGCPCHRIVYVSVFFPRWMFPPCVIKLNGYMRKETMAAANAFMDMFPKTEKPAKENFAAENDREIILQQLRFAENVFPDCGITACPVSHPEISYFSVNSAQILGHPYKSLVSMPIAEFIALTHPEDLPYLRQCFDFIKQFGTSDPTQIRFSICYRIRNAEGEYLNICCENIAVKTERAYLYLMLYSNLPSEVRFHGVRLEISQKFNGKFRKVRTYNPRQTERQITPRQHDIAKLIAKGYANQEIADRLNVSIYTVKNHKQMLFRKVNVKNSMELANYIRDEF
jgi:DNA-binding CsgD family transcriptional regulator